MMAMRVLMSGASGFVGSALAASAAAQGLLLRAAYRELPKSEETFERCVVADIGPDADWRQSLEGIDVVIHCAGVTDPVAGSAKSRWREFQRINVAGTKRFAEQSAEAGVEKFIFVSSVKVNGERTVENRPFTGSAEPAPTDAYAFSKWQAEQALAHVGENTAMTIIVVRPPLVYGPGVKGNLARLLDWVYRELPLPLGSVRNKRSLISVENLVDVLLACARAERRDYAPLLVSDGQDLSTTEVAKIAARAMGKSSRLIPVSPPILRLLGRIVGRGDQVGRLVDNLQIDSSYAQEVLGWQPRIPVEEGLSKTARAFIESRY